MDEFKKRESGFFKWWDKEKADYKTSEDLDNCAYDAWWAGIEWYKENIENITA